MIPRDLTVGPFRLLNVGSWNPAVIYYSRGSLAWRWMICVRWWPWSHRRRWGFTKIPIWRGWVGSLGLGPLGFSLHVQDRLP